MFAMLTMNPNFKILKLAYGNRAIHKTAAGGSDVHKYAPYNYDEDSMNMNIGVNYTSTLANSFDSFQFQNTAYGMFTGLKAFRPNEMLYLTSTSRVRCKMIITIVNIGQRKFTIIGERGLVPLLLPKK